MTANNLRNFIKFLVEHKKRFWHNNEQKGGRLKGRVGCRVLQSQRNLILQDNTLFYFDLLFRNELIFADSSLSWKKQVVLINDHLNIHHQEYFLEIVWGSISSNIVVYMQNLQMNIANHIIRAFKGTINRSSYVKIFLWIKILSTSCISWKPFYI